MGSAYKLDFTKARKRSRVPSVFLLTITTFIAAVVIAAAALKERPVSSCEALSVSLDGTSLVAEVAATADKRRSGMMHRTSFGNADAMLFLYADAQPRSFWMKNTPLPLDILFVDGARSVTEIFHNAEPNSEGAITGPGTTVAVLELPSGRAKSLGIEAGSTATYSLDRCVSL